MSKRKRTTEGERSPSPSSPIVKNSGEFIPERMETVSMILQPGFYVVTSQGEVLTRIVGKVHTDADGVKTKVKCEEPICCRTIAAAKDSCSLASRGGEEHAILCVTAENFNWGE